MLRDEPGLPCQQRRLAPIQFKQGSGVPSTSIAGMSVGAFCARPLRSSDAAVGHAGRKHYAPTHPASTKAESIDLPYLNGIATGGLRAEQMP